MLFKQFYFYISYKYWNSNVKYLRYIKTNVYIEPPFIWYYFMKPILSKQVN